MAGHWTLTINSGTDFSASKASSLTTTIAKPHLQHQFLLSSGSSGVARLLGTRCFAGSCARALGDTSGEREK
jgi:hypothetical protein